MRDNLKKPQLGYELDDILRYLNQRIGSRRPSFTEVITQWTESALPTGRSTWTRSYIEESVASGDSQWDIFESHSLRHVFNAL